MSGAVKGRRWLMIKPFDGVPKDEDMKLERFEIPKLKDGEVLLKAVALSVDPYMRGVARRLPPGSTMIGEQVARVVESKNKDYHRGTVVLTSCGWTTHSVSDGSALTKVEHLPDDLPLSLALGTAGMPGLTAYFGLTEVCPPKAGETVMVSGAAGAVGTVVGQIAKILGCRVIGSAGSDEKVALLKELGFDEAFNYKTIPNLKDAIKAAAPKGVDVYFDNVGGEFASTVINGLNPCGRVISCGCISQYNAGNGETVKVESFWPNVIYGRLTIRGILVYDFADRFPVGRKQLAEWIQQGKLKPKEHVTNGFENMFKAFQELFTGANTGKAVVNV